MNIKIFNKVSVIIAIYFYLTISASSQTYSKFKEIISSDFGRIIHAVLLNDSLNFNGFMIFECPINYRYNSSNEYKEFFITNIYWIENLGDINIENKKLWFDSYYSQLLTYIYYCKTDSNIVKNEKDFCNFVINFRKYFDLNITEFPFLLSSLTTQLFLKEVKPYFVNKDDSVGYFIFKVSFTGTEFEMERDFNTKGKEIKKLNFLFPISKACEFLPVEDSVLVSKGFIKTNWFPDYLYNEK